MTQLAVLGAKIEGWINAYWVGHVAELRHRGRRRSPGNRPRLPAVHESGAFRPRRPHHGEGSDLCTVAAERAAQRLEVRGFGPRWEGIQHPGDAERGHCGRLGTCALVIKELEEQGC
jgi:hypothetical protein